MSTNTPPPNTTFSPGWSAYKNFVTRAKEWEKHIVPVLAGKPCDWLELGSYEGRSAIWTLDNILTHPESTITCVDIFKEGYDSTFDSNIASHPQNTKVMKYKGGCYEMLADLIQLPPGGPFYDGIYIDADHQAKMALTEAAMCWPMLKSGGFMIFDDYPWKHKTARDRKAKLPPKPGIDAFLHCWQHEFHLLHKGWQVIVQKL